MTGKRLTGKRPEGQSPHYQLGLPTNGGLFRDTGVDERGGENERQSEK